MAHPRHVLLGPQAQSGALPVCDHYSGDPPRMRKSLQLQAALMAEMGRCVMDVTLDCEDGAAAGSEAQQAQTVADLLQEFAVSAAKPEALAPRIGVRLHALDHPHFADDVRTIVGAAAERLAYVMLPKVESLAQVEQALVHIDAAARGLLLPLHVLIESPAAVQQVFAIAAHPRVESISFGLMDFVSAHNGAIPAQAMGLRSAGDSHSLDQFHHPLVVRAKLDIASACHAHGKVPSHCVVTELRDSAAIEAAARTAAQALGYTRMWSIHPMQIRPILRGFSPPASEVEQASDIILAAQRQDWAPFSIEGKLHDRASYRYFWQVLERAYRTGVALPTAAHHLFV